MPLLHRQNINQDDPVHRLLAAGRALLKQGDTKFGIAQICARADVEVAEFHALFADRYAFLESLVGQKDFRRAPHTAEQRLGLIEQRLRALEASLQTRRRRSGMRAALALRRVADIAKHVTPAPLARLLTPRVPFAGGAMLVIGAGALLFALLFMPAQRPQSVVSANSLEALINRAETGDANARSALAFAYIAGKIVPHDTSSAARWALLAASQGNADAQYLIASLLSSGDGIAADPQKAFAWFAKSAAQGNIKAMHNLAIAYVQGHGTAKDPAAAADWFARAAAEGYVDSAFDLAVLYEQGLGVKQDPVQALRWYRKAAAAGDHAAASRAHFLETDGHP